MQLLILAGVFFGLVFLIVAIYGVVNRESLEASEAAREQLRTGGAGSVAAVSILRDDRSSEIPFLNKLLDGAGAHDVHRDPARACRLHAESRAVPAHVAGDGGGRTRRRTALGYPRLADSGDRRPLPAVPAG